MKKNLLLTVAAGALLLITGCSSVQTCNNDQLSGIALSDSGKTIAHIEVNYSGWYFLSFPILTGAKDPSDSLVFGQDTCNVTTAVDTLTAQAKSIGGKCTADLVSIKDSSNFLPIPLLFKWKSVTVSANVIR